MCPLSGSCSCPLDTGCFQCNRQLHSLQTGLKLSWTTSPRFHHSQKAKENRREIEEDTTTLYAGQKTRDGRLTDLRLGPSARPDTWSLWSVKTPNPETKDSRGGALDNSRSDRLSPSYTWGKSPGKYSRGSLLSRFLSCSSAFKSMALWFWQLSVRIKGSWHLFSDQSRKHS